MSNVVTGGCLCERYRYEFDRDQVLSAHHCHCRDCRKMTGSGKATIILVPTAALQARGELNAYTVTGADGSHVTRCFCPNCGSGVISYVEELPDIRFIKAGALDDSGWVTIASSFWSSTAEPWAPVDPACVAFERNPVM